MASAEGDGWTPVIAGGGFPTLAQCLQQGLYLQLCGHDFAAIEERDVGGGFSLRLEVPYRLPPGKPSLATPRNAKADGPFVS